jgi:hypothetical protein
MATTKRWRFGPSDVVVAMDGISGTDPSGVPVTLARGTEVRGDHFLVAKLPHLFAPAGTPESEWTSSFNEAGQLLARQESARRQEQERRAAARPKVNPSMPLSALVRCTTTIVQSRWGRCGRGEVRLRTDPIVEHLPEHFQDLIDEVRVG